jgi:tRNA(His) guanylyltransferase
MTVKKDDLGDRMKFFEGFETNRRFLPMLPVYARIDGRGFSKFTKGMNKPFDQRMSNAMIDTTKYLVKETHARIGYTQSDEISLIWMAPDYTGSIFFDGKVTKMTSVLAGMATAAFGRVIRGWSPYEDRYPAFDARVFQLPLPYEAANAILWRSLDATKNAISMAARSHYSAKELHCKNSSTMIEMMSAKAVDFYAYPEAFRLGTFARREIFELQNPENKEGTITRSRIGTFCVSFRDVENRPEVIFSNENPVLKPKISLDYS